MTQESVAEIAELDRKHISMIETGRAEPRIGTLIRIAGALDVPVESHNGQNPPHGGIAKYKRPEPPRMGDRWGPEPPDPRDQPEGSCSAMA